MYDFVRKLLTQLTAVLPNNHFHIGGDEVQYVKKSVKKTPSPGVGVFLDSVSSSTRT